MLYPRVAARLRRLVVAVALMGLATLYVVGLAPAATPRQAPAATAPVGGPGGSRLPPLSMGADSVQALVERSGGQDQRHRRPLQPAGPDRRCLQADG